MAVNVTEVPEQTGFAEAVIVAVTGRFGVTVSETGVPEAGLPVVQVSEEVKVQLIRSPLRGT
jgi:hypothetical protein